MESGAGHCACVVRERAMRMAASSGPVGANPEYEERAAGQRPSVRRTAAGPAGELPVPEIRRAKRRRLRAVRKSAWLCAVGILLRNFGLRPVGLRHLAPPRRPGTPVRLLQSHATPLP